MRKSIFVRSLTDEERTRVKVGLRSNDAFLLRSCQILLASARGAWMPRIAATLGEEHLTIPEMIA